jgi:hypothetical protein
MTLALIGGSLYGEANIHHGRGKLGDRESTMVEPQHELGGAI